MTNLKKTVEVRPAYDKRHPDPQQNYGIHGAELIFALTGYRGTIELKIFTNWHLPNVYEYLLSEHPDPIHLKPFPADLGCHSKEPQYEGQDYSTAHCEYMSGGDKCYYDGSTLIAKKIFDIMISEGSEAMWREIEHYYNAWLAKENGRLEKKK